MPLGERRPRQYRIIDVATPVRVRRHLARGVGREPALSSSSALPTRSRFVVAVGLLQPPSRKALHVLEVQRALRGRIAAALAREAHDLRPRLHKPVVRSASEAHFLRSLIT